MRLVLPFRLAPDTLAAPVPGPQHFLMNHPEKREPVQVQRHRYKKQGVEGGVLSAALKLGQCEYERDQRNQQVFVAIAWPPFGRAGAR